MALGLLVCWTGCSPSGSIDARFRLNLEGRDLVEYPRAKQQDMVNVLEAMFGTPDAPYATSETGLDVRKLQMAAGPTWSDEQGTHRGLYRRHCAHCHGVSGDGAGPTALFLNPYPRDYRRGLFKFKSTERAEKPTTEDLKRILMDGVAGTAMPSFALLPEDEIDILVEYVKYLSIRGETELLLYLLLVEDEEDLDMQLAVDAALMPVVDNWGLADGSVVTPPERPPVDTPQQLAASIEAGNKLFLDQKRAQCTKCHGPTGLGDGGEELYDDWNKDKTPANLADWILPKQTLSARNLRLGIYRGGRRPVDLYRRIHAGINGTPMPAAGPSPGNAGVLKSEEIWQLVDYVRSLPYEAASRPPSRDKVAQKPRM